MPAGSLSNTGKRELRISSAEMYSLEYTLSNASLNAGAFLSISESLSARNNWRVSSCTPRSWSSLALASSEAPTNSSADTSPCVSPNSLKMGSASSAVSLERSSWPRLAYNLETSHSIAASCALSPKSRKIAMASLAMTTASLYLLSARQARMTVCFAKAEIILSPVFSSCAWPCFACRRASVFASIPIRPSTITSSVACSNVRLPC
mmetsp:Transcript_11944/g.32810  ORF Transcript_11944/g.32810 Transcript_11944/m.32810 type:complete len:207 (+) Transcript_11944:470-1090(+)